MFRQYHEFYSLQSALVQYHGLFEDAKVRSYLRTSLTTFIYKITYGKLYTIFIKKVSSGRFRHYYSGSGPTNPENFCIRPDPDPQH